jgi:uncharacterized membrane protein
MRNGTAIALVLAFCVTGCDKGTDDPVPIGSDLPTAAPSGASPAPAESPAPTATASTGPAPAPTPTAAANDPGAASVVPTGLRALGTEPFWNARISGGMLTYSTPEDQKGQRAALTRRDRADGVEFSGKLGASAIRIAVSRRTCSDGMSNRSYPFTVVLTLGNDRREGCAS